MPTESIRIVHADQVDPRTLYRPIHEYWRELKIMAWYQIHGGCDAIATETTNLVREAA